MVGLFYAAVCVHAFKPFSSTLGRQDWFMLNEHVMKVCQSLSMIVLLIAAV
jgi:hypothetical protein